MKLTQFVFGLICSCPTFPCHSFADEAGKPGAASAAAAVEEDSGAGTGSTAGRTSSAAKENATWGKAVDPDEDCKLVAQGNKLTIEVPGGKSHDLSAELSNTNAPRSMQEVEGDFTVQVKVDGDTTPGSDSTQAGRGSFHAGGLLLMMDDGNFVRLERASVQWTGEAPETYINYEIRENGKLAKFGNGNDTDFKPKGATYLRIERKGNVLQGAASSDGENWTLLNPMELPANWPNKISVGVAALSTSQHDSSQQFEDLKIGKSAKTAAPSAK
jgi:regulation of enolase protein 1 (concanavalin A-like superfamily)